MNADIGPWTSLLYALKARFLCNDGYTVLDDNLSRMSMGGSHISNTRVVRQKNQSLDKPLLIFSILMYIILFYFVYCTEPLVLVRVEILL